MTFTLYPAIDVLNGKCVRLEQGNYDKETVYGDSPTEMARTFADDGAKWIHIVDLDGAKAKRPINQQEIIRAVQQVEVPVQVGGGIRTEADIQLYLDAGVARVVLGSVAVNNPEFTKEMLEKYNEKIAIGIDAKNGFVATEGWLETSQVSAERLAQEMSQFGAEVFIFTDISRDGMLTGPNIEACEQLSRVAGVEVIASGGVSQLGDIVQLAESHVSGAIVGKALYEKRFTLKEALTVGSSSC
ncbi:phosphoribosylformimino-5-aminoimidazole carboxamide ribotide isomerase [Bacillus sp. JCM 19046]|nr:phosphoribosylformimino-5-aminoimidazole carboxamide ribotide isomerase [Bacillus sp. JCM 19045]GAF18394.1 phosphoribosylformimino-5-aminoimidazole carboxamide ribotide isomerase [Bacillus sp. JCM 19046]